MASSGDREFITPPSPAATAVLLVVVMVWNLVIACRGLWQGWHRHHVSGWDIIQLLASLYLAIVIYSAGRRAWRKRCGNNETGKTA